MPPRTLKLPRYAPRAEAVNVRFGRRDSPRGDGPRCTRLNRAPLRCTSPLELAVGHWLKTPSTGSRNDANDPHGCRGTIAQLACMWTIARPAPHRVHRQCNKGIDEDACWQHWARYSTRGSDSPSPATTARCDASPIDCMESMPRVGPHDCSPLTAARRSRASPEAESGHREPERLLAPLTASLKASEAP